jgi:hypothetical protein
MGRSTLIERAIFLSKFKLLLNTLIVWIMYSGWCAVMRHSFWDPSHSLSHQQIPS